jgi:excisionase family DNA binding protein
LLILKVQIIQSDYQEKSNLMSEMPKTLSVAKAADLCGVGRTTVGYWIRSKKLYASRKGRSYSIPVEDLLVFLQNSGQPVPTELYQTNSGKPIFKSFQKCWQHWKGSQHANHCGDCIAYKNQIDACFTIRNSGLLGCSECDQCRYYMDTFYPRIQFVHQINLPAAIVRDFHLWGGNAQCADLCDVQPKELIGMAVEKIVHARSLGKIIQTARNMAFKDLRFENNCTISINGDRGRRRVIQVSIFPLQEPNRVFLVLGMPKKFI